MDLLPPLVTLPVSFGSILVSLRKWYDLGRYDIKGLMCCRMLSVVGLIYLVPSELPP